MHSPNSPSRAPIPGWIAGGTDVMVELGRSSKPAKRLIDLTALEPELRFITKTTPA